MRDAKPKEPLRGNLEWLTRFGAAGWARRGATPLRLEAVLGARVVAVAVADIYRADLAAAGEADGACAFEMWFDPPLPEGPLPALTIRTPDGTPLMGTTLAELAASAEVSGCLPAALQGERPVALVVDEAAPDATRDAASVALISHMQALHRLGYAVAFAPMIGAGAVACLLGERLALAYVQRLRPLLTCHGTIRAANPRARLVFALADLASLRAEREAQLLGGAAPRGLRAAEAAAVAAADLVVTHSPAEAAILRARFPRSRVHAVPWTVPLRPALEDWAERQGIGFIGSFGHAPNLDAVQVLLRGIMPLLWRRAPIPCVIAGRGAPAWLQGCSGGLVSVLGPVADTAELWRRVRVSAAPLRFGAGVKGKVLDSLAAGVPCVCSPVAAEGIDLPAELLATNPAEMAERLLELHEDSRAHAAAVSAGLGTIARNHSEAAVARALQDALRG